MTIPDTTEKMDIDDFNKVQSAFFQAHENDTPMPRVFGIEVDGDMGAAEPDLAKQAHEVVERAETAANPTFFTSVNMANWAAMAKMAVFHPQISAQFDQAVLASCETHKNDSDYHDYWFAKSQFLQTLCHQIQSKAWKTSIGIGEAKITSTQPYPTITECNGMRFKSVQFQGVISLSGLINSSITDRWSVLKVELNTVDGTGTLKLWQWAVKR